jgi:hypothetical protein
MTEFSKVVRLSDSSEASRGRRAVGSFRTPGSFEGSSSSGESVSILHIPPSSVYNTEIGEDYVITFPVRFVMAEADSGAPSTITLPNAALYIGAVVIVKKIDSGADDVIVQRADSATIDGEVSWSLPFPNNVIVVLSDGTNWHILSMNREAP